MPKMVNIKGFAAASGLSVWAVRLLVAEGKIPAIRIGQGRGRIFVNMQHADAALDALDATKTQEPSGGIRRVF